MRRKDSFFKQVYRVVKQIPEGKVTTYGQVAIFLKTKDARRVGHALYANKDPRVPCHRVVDRMGRLSPSFSFNGWQEQRERLEKEGVCFVDQNHVDLKNCQWELIR